MDITGASPRPLPYNRRSCMLLLQHIFLDIVCLFTLHEWQCGSSVEIKKRREWKISRSLEVESFLV